MIRVEIRSAEEASSSNGYEGWLFAYSRSQNEPPFPNSRNVRRSSERYSLLRDRMSDPRRSRHIDPLKTDAQSARGIMASSEMEVYDDHFLTCSSDRKRFIWLQANPAGTSPA